jgi:hypothetical protein
LRAPIKRRRPKKVGLLLFIATLIPNGPKTSPLPWMRSCKVEHKAQKASNTRKASGDALKFAFSQMSTADAPLDTAYNGMPVKS